MDTQANIQRQAALLQSILENAPVGIALFSGPDLTCRFANPLYCSMLPDPARSPVGRPYAELWGHAAEPAGQALLQQVIATRRVMSLDHAEQVFPDGSRRSFTLQVHPFAWGDEPAGLVFAEETTETDRIQRLSLSIAEEARRRADEWDAVINAMAEAVILFLPNGQPEHANPAAVELYGFDPTGISAADLVSILGMRHRDGNPLEVDELPSQRALRGEPVTGQPLLLVDAHGEERVVHVSASPIFHDDTVTSVVTVWHDVTERERLLDQLEIEQSRMITIIQNAPEGILVADEEGRIVLGNPAAQRILGRDLPYGQDFETHRQLGICYEDGTPYDPRNLPLTASALDGERLKDVELLVHLPDGGTRYLLASTAPIIDRWGNLNGAVGIFQDITARKHAFDREAQRARELHALNQATTALLSTIDLETLLFQILDAAHNAIPAAETGGLFLAAGSPGQPSTGEGTSGEGSPSDSALRKLEVRATFGCEKIGQLMERLKPYLRQAIEARNPLCVRELEDAHTRSAIIAPLMVPQDVLGVLVLCGSTPDRFSEDDLRLLDSFAATASAALQNATLYAEVQRLATTDTLTEQYNRRRFFELGELEMHRFRRFHNPLSAIMLDLDNFKEINDTFGHGIGDYVLHTVAKRTRSSIRIVDILGRYGGDEFAILLPNADLNEAREIAERIRQAVIGEPIETSRGKIELTISLGLTQATLVMDNLSTLLGRADAALMRAKQNGRNQVCCD